MKYRHLDTDISVMSYENMVLLQADKPYTIDKFFLEGHKILAITNGSYFFGEGGYWYANGRNQGDLTQNTYATEENGKWCDFVIDKKGVHWGKFNNWDYPEAQLGVSMAMFLIRDGLDVQEYSELIKDSKSRYTTRSQHTAIMETKDGKLHLVVADGRATDQRGLTGEELRGFLKTKYDIKNLGLMDGGGSTQAMEKGEWVLKSTRGVLNAIAFVEKEVVDLPTIQYPCKEGWDSQTFHEGHKALDFGWLKSQSSNGKTPILACLDGEVEYADYYEEVVNGKTVKPIVCILKHDIGNYTYRSAYWHLSSTPLNKGDKVKQGAQIGVKGNTGYSQGVHLHFVFMRMPKGSPMPKSTEFDKYAINPIDLIRVYPDQIFEYKGNFNLENATIDYESTIDSLMRENYALAKENQIIEQEVIEVRSALEKAQNDLKKVTSTLEAVKQYVELMGKIL